MSVRRTRLRRLKVELPARVTADAADSVAVSAATALALPATCIDLGRTNARFSADGSPPVGSEVQMDISLPNDRRARLAGFVISSLITTAPAVLCGDRNRALGATFEVEFQTGSPDLTYVVDLIESRMVESRRIVARKLRRTHLGPWLRA